MADETTEAHKPQFASAPGQARKAATVASNLFPRGSFFLKKQVMPWRESPEILLEVPFASSRGEAVSVRNGSAPHEQGACHA